MALVIIVATAAAFAYYIHGHPQTVDQLKQLPPTTVFILLGLYAVTFLAYVMVTRASLRIYDKKMSRQENILFNAYSSLINFFGPGQSGPIFRGAYLKKRHNLGVKQFMFTMLIYFGFYAVVSAMFMLIGSRPGWQTAALMVMVGAVSFVLIRRYKQKSHINAATGLNILNIGWILAATALQVATFAVIYGIELSRVGAGASIGQILSYTGVSNLSLFVALTPGAIGIREAFLVFSQNLHGIGNSNIVAANIIDRGVYLLFLGLLFVLVISLHARDKLNVQQLQAEKPDR